MSNTLLQLDQLSKSFGNLKAVDQLSITLEKGNVYGLLGPNGSGKSTTLGMILNVINPTSGSFSWCQGDLTTHGALKKNWCYHRATQFLSLYVCPSKFKTDL